MENPVQTAGFSGSAMSEKFIARMIRVPGRGPFFDDVAVHEFVIMGQ